MLIAFNHHESLQWSADEIALQRACAGLMMASVKRSTPGAEFIHLTDMDTPAFANRVMRCEPRADDNRCVSWCEQIAELPTDTVILDTDVIVLADLHELLITKADIVVTQRRNPERRIAGRYMPYLFGVCMSRTPAFWRDMRDRVVKMAGEDARWWGIQITLPVMVTEGRWNIQSVPCDEWNYTPKAGESIDGRKALHYKGQRKELMVQEWRTS